MKENYHIPRLESAMIVVTATIGRVLPIRKGRKIQIVLYEQTNSFLSVKKLFLNEPIKLLECLQLLQNTKEKLRKDNEAIWFNKMCRFNRLTPKYTHIKVKENYAQSK